MTGREGETFPGFFHDREERPDTGRVDARCLGKGDALKNGTAMDGEKWGCGPVRRIVGAVPLVTDHLDVCG